MVTFFLALTLQLWADTPPSLVGFYPGEVLRNEVVEFKPIEGHHFSPEAPQNCGTGQVNERSPRMIKCQFTQSGVTSATLNVCDDKKTFCRPLQLKINVIQRETASVEDLTKNEHLNKDLKHTLVPGFTFGHADELVKAAADKKQPVFVMISTDWCPPCNEAKEYLLQSPAFKTASENWFKIYVDGDSLEAADWEKVVPYAYFPSFVLLNSQMQEIGRYTGEIRQSDFATWAKEQTALAGDPISELKPRVLARLDGKWSQKARDIWSGVSPADQFKQKERLLRWALDRADNDLVKTLIAKGEQFPALDVDLLHFQISDLENREQKDGVDLKAEKIELYKRLLSLTFKGEHWSETLQGLCDVDVASCKPFVEKITERLSLVAAQSEMQAAEKESQLGDEYYYVSEIYHAVDDKAALKEFALKCAGHFAAMTGKSLLKISRAGQQGMVACLELAGDFQHEETTLKALIKAYPAEPTFMWRMARMLHKERKTEAALQWVTQAEGLAYGYNWFTLQILKADLLLDLKKRNEAKTVIDRTLAQVSLDSNQQSRNQGLVLHLRSLQAKVSKN